MIGLRIPGAASTALKWCVIGRIKGIYGSAKVATAVRQLEASKTSEADHMSGVASVGGVAVTLARGIIVEAAAVSIWGRVTGGGSARRRACRVGALRQCGRGQRDARRRNSCDQYEFDLVDHGLSPEFRCKQGRDAVLFDDQEMRSTQVILN